MSVSLERSFYIPTVTADSVEIRGYLPIGESATLRFADTEFDLHPLIEDQEHFYFRHRLDGLVADAHYEVSINDRRLSFRTLKAPAAPRLLRLGLLPDSHLQPGAANRPINKRAKRLYPLAESLSKRYVARMQSDGTDRILFLGDTMDPMTADTLSATRSIFSTVKIPCHPIIGNHELYGSRSAADFNQAFELPDSGDYSIRHDKVTIICLATPDQACLARESVQFKWLQRQLAANRGQIILIAAHFSLVLHPCVQGRRNDGMQQVYDPGPVLELLAEHPNAVAWLAGHKNIPSKIIKDDTLHLLSPQLIQYPCAYVTLDIYEDAIVHNTHEIIEQDVLHWSRGAYGQDYPERHGEDRDRNFTWFFRSLPI